MFILNIFSARKGYPPISLLDPCFSQTFLDLEKALKEIESTRCRGSMLRFFLKPLCIKHEPSIKAHSVSWIWCFSEDGFVANAYSVGIPGTGLIGWHRGSGHLLHKPPYFSESPLKTCCCVAGMTKSEGPPPCACPHLFSHTWAPPRDFNGAPPRCQVALRIFRNTPHVC